MEKIGMGFLRKFVLQVLAAQIYVFACPRCTVAKLFRTTNLLSTPDR